MSKWTNDTDNWYASLQVLEMMGGEHAGLSAAQKGLYDPNIMGTTENRDSDGS